MGTIASYATEVAALPATGTWSNPGKGGAQADIVNTADCEADGHLGSVVVCRHQMAAGPEVGRGIAERGQEPLGPAH
ncbi:hypothetical protein [Streptomyces canus]|uniref:hypothetical protein n=1 Tax=Streptomyces canus TaxID=58343 RepID=UPI0027D79DE7|nr:hypothetical protein [Streptomyces canus]